MTNTAKMAQNTELTLLEALYTMEGEQGPVSQRALARKAGLSLGMTNTLLKRFFERGWIKLTRLDARKVHYAMTPEGVEEISRKAVGFFVRAAENARVYWTRIDDFAARLARNGYEGIILESPLELDFLFEYACLRHGLWFVARKPGLKADAGHLAHGMDRCCIIGETEKEAQVAAKRKGTGQRAPERVNFADILRHSEAGGGAIT